jgi:hypothetical protein
VSDAGECFESADHMALSAQLLADANLFGLACACCNDLDVLVVLCGL